MLLTVTVTMAVKHKANNQDVVCRAAPAGWHWSCTVHSPVLGLVLGFQDLLWPGV